MTIAERLLAFEKLGNYLNAIDEGEFDELLNKIRNENPWFTYESVRTALNGLHHYLHPKKLKQWVSNYQLNPAVSKKIAVVMAGNIPLAGFHDFLTVLVSGHAIQMKLSSKDSVLPTFISRVLTDIEARFESRITIAEQLKDFSAVIATGSDNSARYFDYYFGKYPHIIRKNRTACSIITGTESQRELELLGNDVFTYFGLGCRNVSKVFMPNDFDPVQLIKAWEPYTGVIDHHKYHNNYDYQKSILLVNKIPFYDSGFVILHENEKLVSPISVVYYERYSDEQQLTSRLKGLSEKIQCIVGKGSPEYIPFGQAQSPELWDYADKVDTLKFLAEIQ